MKYISPLWVGAIGLFSLLPGSIIGGMAGHVIGLIVVCIVIFLLWSNGRNLRREKEANIIMQKLKGIRRI